MKKRPTSWRCRNPKQQKDKQEIYNSREWRELRIQKLRANPLCEVCEREGIVTAARCVYHVVPIETARTKDEMRRLAIDCGLQGLKSLCLACHAKIHKEQRSHTKEVVKASRQNRKPPAT